jgi:hypothetical protein
MPELCEQVLRKLQATFLAKKSADLGAARPAFVDQLLAAQQRCCHGFRWGANTG